MDIHGQYQYCTNFKIDIENKRLILQWKLLVYARVIAYDKPPFPLNHLKMTISSFISYPKIKPFRRHFLVLRKIPKNIPNLCSLFPKIDKMIISSTN